MGKFRCIDVVFLLLAPHNLLLSSRAALQRQAVVTVAKYEDTMDEVRQTSEFLSGSDGKSIFTRQWTPAVARGALVIVHGFGDHSGRYSNLAIELAGRGIQVTAYDQRGHGRSPGRRGHVARWSQYRTDLEWLLDRVRGEHPNLPLFLFGHSMGGLVSLEFLLQPRPVSGAIISAPPLDPSGVANPFLVGLAYLLSGILPWFRVPLPLHAADLSRDPSAVAAFQADPLTFHQASARWGTEILAARKRVLTSPESIRVPILFAHGEADRIAAIQGTRHFFDRLVCRDKELRTYPDAYHELHSDLNQQQVVTDYTDWLARHIG
jgi:alpha-beta hydrolase superfamily lysophospholipase